MILALARQFKQLSHEPEKFRFMRQLLELSSKCEDHIFIILRLLLSCTTVSDMLDISANHIRKQYSPISRSFLSPFQLISTESYLDILNDFTFNFEKSNNVVIGH